MGSGRPSTSIDGGMPKEIAATLVVTSSVVTAGGKRTSSAILRCVVNPDMALPGYGLVQSKPEKLALSERLGLAKADSRVGHDMETKLEAFARYLMLSR
jgi:hypothetical protein